MKIKLNKFKILEEFETLYDKRVKEKLDSIGLGQMEDRKSPDKEMQKEIDKDETKRDNSTGTEYFKTIYDNQELKDLENPPSVTDLNIPKD